MRFRNVVLAVVLLVNGIALAQTASFSYQVRDKTGKIVSNPLVRVCIEPATGVTCSPLANVFSDPGLSNPLGNPFNGDMNGNVVFYSAFGVYHIQINGPGITQIDLSYVSLGGISPWINLANYAKGDARYITGTCSTTNASYSVSCSTGNFTSQDIGKLVVIYGARANGSGATATTTLSSGAITTPTVTAAGSAYLTPPSVSVSGLTCTYNPELRAILAGSNYQTGNAVASIQLIYAGSGCSGTPSISITSAPNLALAGSVASITNSTTVVLTTNVAPSVTTGSLSMLIGTDDTSFINGAIQALAQNSDTGLNPVPIYCGKLYMISGPINIINKSIKFESPGPGNLSSTAGSAPSQQGCAIILVNQSYTTATDAVYVAGAQFSSVRGLHIYSVSGNKQRAAIRLQQPGSVTHNTQYNRFEDNLIGPWYTGGANGNDPEANACFTGAFVLNQCAQFQWGFMFDSPTGYPNTGGANNDQMVFSNDLAAGVDIGFYAFSNQSAELTLDRFMCDGCNVGIQTQSNLSCRECDISNSRTADIVLGDPLYSGNNGLLRLDLMNYTSEGSHQFLVGGANSSFNNVPIFLHGNVSWQVGSSTIKSGTVVDLSPLTGGGNVSINTDNGISILGVMPATTAPVNYKWFSGPSYSQGPNYVQTNTNIAFNVPDPPLNQWGNLQLTYPDYRQSQLFRRDWLVGTARCHTDMIFYGGSPDSIECNNVTTLGKQRIVGELLLSQVGSMSATPSCTKLSGSGATTYFYKMAGVVAGIAAPPSPEASCASQAASLSASAVNQVCGTPLAGAQQYAIYESTSSGTEKLLATVNADQMIPGGSNLLCYNDAAGGAAGASPANSDGTGGANFPGPVVFGQGLNAPSLNINGDGVMTENPRIPWSCYLPTLGSGNVNICQVWNTNVRPVVVTEISAIVTGGFLGSGCTASIPFYVKDTNNSTQSSSALMANGAQQAVLHNVNFVVPKSHTIELIADTSSITCTQAPTQVNMMVEVEPQ